MNDQKDSDDVGDKIHHGVHSTHVALPTGDTVGIGDFLANAWRQGQISEIESMINRYDGDVEQLVFESSFWPLVSPVPSLQHHDTFIKSGESKCHIASLACRAGYERLVRALLAKGVPVETTDIWGCTLLSQACEYGRQDVVTLLLSMGAKIALYGFQYSDINDRHYSRHPLDIACTKGHVNIVRLLLDQGASISATPGRWGSPLMNACQSGHRCVVELLLDRGARVDERGAHSSHYPIHVACINNHANVVDVLLEHGDNIDRQSDVGDTPLRIACINLHVTLVQKLLLLGAQCKGQTDSTVNVYLTTIIDDYQDRRVSRQGFFMHPADLPKAPNPRIDSRIRIAAMLLSSGAKLSPETLEQYRYCPLELRVVILNFPAIILHQLLKLIVVHHDPRVRFKECVIDNDDSDNKYTELPTKRSVCCYRVIRAMLHHQLSWDLHLMIFKGMLTREFPTISPLLSGLKIGEMER